MSTQPNTKSTNLRFIDLDLLKILAIALMIYDHVIKFLVTNLNLALPLEAYFIFVFTPFSSALFLFISGLLLQYRTTLNHTSTAYYRKRLQSGLLLIGISYLLWFLAITDGTFLSTGILQTLGVLWVWGIGFEWLVPKKYQSLLLGILMVGLLCLHQLLLQQQIYLTFINVYAFPLLPHGLYFLLGMLVAQLRIRPVFTKYKTLLRIIVISGMVGIYLSTDRGLLWELTHLPVLFGYWSPSLILTSYTLLLLLLLSTFLSEVPSRADPLSAYLVPIAKLALPIYIGHLVGLRVLETIIL